MEQKSSTNRSLPITCPTCEYPLTDKAQCTSPDCPDAQFCEYCNVRLNIYGACTTPLCLMARCDVCSVPLNIHGTCRNPGCAKYENPATEELFKSPGEPPGPGDTLKPSGERIAVCDTCHGKYSSILESCPYCAEGLINVPDEPFSEEVLDEDGADPCHAVRCPNPTSCDTEAASGAKNTSVRKSSAPDVKI